MSDQIYSKFTEHDCRLALRRYLRQRKKLKSCAAGLFSSCIVREQFDLCCVENHMAYKVTCKSVVERRSNHGYSVMNPIEAESAKRESPNPQPGREFESSERYVYLFGEAEQRTCDKCNGSGRQDCTVCNARGHIDCDCLEEPCLPDLPSESIYGKESCELCDGCTFCYTCRDCDGRQLVRCRLCSGTGQTNHVPQMLIKRTLLYNRQVLDTPEGLDESLVELAKGLPEPNGTAAVKIVEAQLRDMHSGMLRINKDEAMTHQLLQTQCIPIAKVLYKCKNDKQGTFWVIGVSGNFCYCPKLPWTTISSIITENE